MFKFRVINKLTGTTEEVEAASLPDVIDKTFGEGASTRLTRGGSRYRVTVKQGTKVIGSFETLGAC